MIFKLSEIAVKIGATLEGEDKEIAGLSTVDEPIAGTLTFANSQKYLKKLRECDCAAAIVPPGAKSEKHSLLVMNDPYLGFGLAMRLFYNDHKKPQPGIEKSAVIDYSSEIGKDAYIGHNTVIGKNVKIGARTIIHNNVVIDDRSIIGEDCYIYHNSTLMHDIKIGNRVAIYAGAVIGSDGFGYAGSKNGFVKIPQAGTVVIEDDVEIGANTTIDRATLGETRIGAGTIIDNLVQIAHNCKIGPGSILCAQVGLAGSTELGRGVILAGQVGVAGHLKIGDGTIAQAQSGIPKSVPAKSVIFGSPAREARLAQRIEAYLNHLPDYMKRLKQMEKKLAVDDAAGEAEPNSGDNS